MAMIRPQIKAAIKWDINHDLEEFHWLETEEIPCKIFAREAKNGTHEIISMLKDQLHKISHRVESGDALYLSLIDVGRIIFLLHYQKHLLDQKFHPDDVSFRHVSITLHDFNAFRTHPDNLDALSQAGDIKVATPRSFLPPNAPVCQLTPTETFKKSTKRDASLLSNFKDGKFWDKWRRSAIATANA